MKHLYTVPQLFLLFDAMSSFNTARNISDELNDYSIELGVINISRVEGNISLYSINITDSMYYETVVERVASPIDIYFTPFLVTFGISGNTLTIFVLFSSKLKHLSTTQYLSALAVSDTVFLAELLPPWLSTMDINGVFHQDAYCKGFVYVSYVSCCLSAWLVIAFTVERFVAVHYPLQCPSVCTVRRARYIIASLMVGAMAVNLPVIQFTGSGNKDCNIVREKLEQAARFNWVDTTVTFTIPLLLIIILNTSIAVKVYKLERDRSRLTQEELRVITMRPQKSCDSDFVYRRAQRRITNMLLIVSSIFVLFNCPAYTLRVCGYAYDMDAGDLDDKWLKAQNVATMMFNANFGMNFFLYCCTGQNFRRALMQMVPCLRSMARRVRNVVCGAPAQTADDDVESADGAVETAVGAAVIADRATEITEGSAVTAAAANAANPPRAPSITPSAASTSTATTCMDMSCWRPTSRRNQPEPNAARNRIMHWAFDNSHQRHAAAVSGESFAMQAITAQPRPSHASHDNRPRPVAPTSFSAGRQRAVAMNPPILEEARAVEITDATVENRRPFAITRRSSWGTTQFPIDMRRNAPEMRRIAFDERSGFQQRRRGVDASRSAIDTRRTVIDTRRPIIEVGPSGIGMRRSSRPYIDLTRPIADPRSTSGHRTRSAFELGRANSELRPRMLPQMIAAERRRASRLRRFLQLFRRDSDKRRRERAYLYD